MAAKFKLDKADGSRLLKSFGLSMAGAALIWISQVLIPGLDWQSASWGPYVGALAPFVVNVLRKWLSEER